MSLVKELLHDKEQPPRPVKLRILRPVFVRETVCESTHQDLASQTISSSRQVYELLAEMAQEAREHFVALHLDSKNKILCMDRVSTGSLNASIVHPRELFKSTLLSSAAAIVLAHNHPSGDPTPSREDMELTSRLQECGELLGIRVLDHIIIGEGEYVSLADRGLL